MDLSKYLLPRCTEKYYGKYSPVLFLCYDNMHYMHFVFSVKSVDDVEEVLDLMEILLHCGAHISFNLADASDYSVIIVDHNEVVNVKAPAFKLNYFLDCIQENRLKRIGEIKYRQEATMHIVDEVDCLEVVYFRKKTWADVLSEEEKLWFDRNMTIVTNTLGLRLKSPKSLLRGRNHSCRSDEEGPEAIVEEKEDNVNRSHSSDEEVSKEVIVEEENMNRLCSSDEEGPEAVREEGEGERDVNPYLNIHEENLVAFPEEHVNPSPSSDEGLGSEEIIEDEENMGHLINASDDEDSIKEEMRANHPTTSDEEELNEIRRRDIEERKQLEIERKKRMEEEANKHWEMVYRDKSPFYKEIMEDFRNLTKKRDLSLDHGIAFISEIRRIRDEDWSEEILNRMKIKLNDIPSSSDEEDEAEGIMEKEENMDRLSNGDKDVEICEEIVEKTKEEMNRVPSSDAEGSNEIPENMMEKTKCLDDVSSQKEDDYLPKDQQIDKQENKKKCLDVVSFHNKYEDAVELKGEKEEKEENLFNFEPADHSHCSEADSKDEKPFAQIEHGRV